MTEDQEAIAFYRRPGVFTDLRQSPPLLRDLPQDVPGLCRVVQGLLIHRMWAPAYGVSISGREWEEGLHGADVMLDRILALDPAPLSVPRPPSSRLVTCCRHFAVLLCALLRHHGVPARARCGFAGYFEAGRFLDHWACEYWHVDQRRWILVDAQLDEVQMSLLKPDFDPLDVPREAFWTAGQAWHGCRTGLADPSLFGIADMWGLWFIRGNLLRDLASQNKVELLPWDVWGAAIDRDDLITETETLFLDQIAARTITTDADNFSKLRRLYEVNETVRPSAEFLQELLEKDKTGGTGKNPLST